MSPGTGTHPPCRCRAGRRKRFKTPLLPAVVSQAFLFVALSSHRVQKLLPHCETTPHGFCEKTLGRRSFLSLFSGPAPLSAARSNTASRDAEHAPFHTAPGQHNTTSHPPTSSRFVCHGSFPTVHVTALVYGVHDARPSKHPRLPFQMRIPDCKRFPFTIQHRIVHGDQSN